MLNSLRCTLYSREKKTFCLFPVGLRLGVVFFVWLFWHSLTGLLKNIQFNFPHCIFFFSPNFMDFLVVVFGFYGFINVDIFSLLSLVLECDVCFWTSHLCRYPTQSPPSDPCPHTHTHTHTHTLTLTYILHSMIVSYPQGKKKLKKLKSCFGLFGNHCRRQQSGRFSFQNGSIVRVHSHLEITLRENVEVRIHFWSGNICWYPKGTSFSWRGFILYVGWTTFLKSVC